MGFVWLAHGAGGLGEWITLEGGGGGVQDYPMNISDNFINFYPLQKANL